ncbi:MAG: peptidyl-prolyl cis-trans isomerase [Bdellovibrionaceae bacterium]|nr:peptidyl-prolyl cis-trans isomerase [Bdellovibrio sp.]
MTWSFQATAAEKKKTAETKSESIVMQTSMGKIVVKLNAEKAPRTVANFFKYVEQKHFDGTIFHRVIKDFMIQGGGFTPDMKEKSTSAPIEIESNNGLFNKRGTIAMARTNDPNSATAQFFINTVDNARLDYSSPSNPGYAVFGEVTSGMDVVDKIRAVKTSNKNGMDDVPVETVTINSIRKGSK